MNKEFIPYEEALALKELGFEEGCLGYYYGEEFIACNSSGEFIPYKKQTDNNSALAPLYQQSFRWFMEKGYHCGIIPRYDEFHYFIKDFVNDKEYDDVYNISSYEEAELACLRKLIEIVNQTKDDE